MRIFISKCLAAGIKFYNLQFRVIDSARKCKRSARAGGEKYFGDYVIDYCGYADDVLLAFENNDEMQRAVIILDEVFKSYQLKINVSKTKSMVFNHPDDIDYPKTLTTLNHEPIENVQSFRYLGNVIEYNQANTGDAEIQLRMRLADGQFAIHKNKFKNQNISLSTRVLLFNSLVRSRLTYGSQTWNLKQRQLNQLDSFYCSRLRRLVNNGYKRKGEEDNDNNNNDNKNTDDNSNTDNKNDSSKNNNNKKKNKFALKYSNKDILRICNCEKLSDFNFRLQIAYLGHIIRTPNTNPAKQLLFNEILVKGKPIIFLDSLESMVLKRLKNEFHVDRDQFYRSCLDKSEHQLIPEPQHKKTRNLVRGGRRRRKLRNITNNNKSVRGKAKRKQVEPAGRFAAADNASRLGVCKDQVRL